MQSDESLCVRQLFGNLYLTNNWAGIYVMRQPRYSATHGHLNTVWSIVSGIYFGYGYSDLLISQDHVETDPVFFGECFYNVFPA